MNYNGKSISCSGVGLVGHFPQQKTNALPSMGDIAQHSHPGSGVCGKVRRAGRGQDDGIDESGSLFFTTEHRLGTGNMPYRRELGKAACLRPGQAAMDGGYGQGANRHLPHAPGQNCARIIRERNRREKKTSRLHVQISHHHDLRTAARIS